MQALSEEDGVDVDAEVMIMKKTMILKVVYEECEDEEIALREFRELDPIWWVGLRLLLEKCNRYELSWKEGDFDDGVVE